MPPPMPDDMQPQAFGQQPSQMGQTNGILPQHTSQDPFAAQVTTPVVPNLAETTDDRASPLLPSDNYIEKGGQDTGLNYQYSGRQVDDDRE